MTTRAWCGSSRAISAIPPPRCCISGSAPSGGSRASMRFDCESDSEADRKVSMRWLLLLGLVALPACYDLSKVETRHTTSNVIDWRDEVIYQLLVDRFANGNRANDDRTDPTALARYQGGDWQGVIDHLDYLDRLGVTAIWISPVIRNVDTDANVDGYHGYWAQDMTATNPHMGDLAKLRELVDKAHARGMKVILDIVTNHLGQLFFYDINGNGVPDENISGAGGMGSALERVTEYDPDYDPRGIQADTSLGESGSAPIRWIYQPEIHRMPPRPAEFQNPDWYNRRGRITSYANANHQPGEQVYKGDFPGGLKDLKTSHPDVQAALARVFNEWIDKADFDAFRIDTLKHVEHEFWQEFCPAVRKHCKAIGKKNFFMFGEAFDGDDALVGSFTGDNQVDSAFFFPQKFAVIDRVIKEGKEGTTSIEKQFKTLKEAYGAVPNVDGPVSESGQGLAAQQLMVNFLDNHDIPRFLYEKISPPPLEPHAALHSALDFLFTEIGIPCVYYGTEQQFRGGNDPANRERLWDSGFDEGNPTFKHIQRLTGLRKNFRPLRRGDLQVRWATDRKGDEVDAGVFAFERSDGGKSVLVVQNFSDKHESKTVAPQGGRMKVSFPPGTGLVNVFGPSEPLQVGGDGTVVVSVPPRDMKVFVPQDDKDGIP
ncbi:MAG: alpha-amylase [Myxococcales bacterium]|nr:alpha-amylase [Myxococcales bacterium]